MIVWIEARLAMAIHDRLLAEHGGSSGVRDARLLESALARPQQLHARGDPPPDLAELAASLAQGIARNQPFVDGNKRTAYVVCHTFLALNGVELVASIVEKYLNIVALAEGRMKPEDFAAWLRRHIPSPPRDRLHEPQVRYAVSAPSRGKRPSR